MYTRHYRNIKGGVITLLLLFIMLFSGCNPFNPFWELAIDQPSDYEELELGDITGPDGLRYICYEDSLGNTVSHSFNVPVDVQNIVGGTIYVRYTNNDPEGYLRACGLLINDEPSHCSCAIGCYRIAQHQVRGFTAARGRTVEATFDIQDVKFPVQYPETGSIQVDLLQYLGTGRNSLTTWVSYGSGEGSLVTVRIVLKVE